jgi:hypothetical protein
MNYLRRVVKLLREADSSEKFEQEKGEDSIDSQIDQFFSDFEKEGKNSQLEGLDLYRMTKRFLLEAEEDEEKDKEEDKPEEKDAEEEPPAEEEKKKLTIEDINIDSFADGVIRLIDNYDSLLEIRNTILRRAVNHLLKDYEPDVADAFKESVEDRHGLTIGKSKFEKEDDDFQPPGADRAGASPGGA